MKVELLYYTENILDMVARMAHSTRELHLERVWSNNTSKDDFFRDLIKWKHFGPFEYIDFVFHASKVSKNLSHQLVRHRIATYLQQSSRHVKPHPAGYVSPPSIRKNDEVLGQYERWMEQTHDRYIWLIENDVPIEDARYLLPSGYFTHISIKMNGRELMHFFELRCDKHAQWEIANLAWKMLKICYEKYPIIFEQLYNKYKDDERWIK